MGSSRKCSACGLDLKEGSSSLRCDRCTVTHGLLLADLEPPPGPAADPLRASTDDEGLDFGDYVLLEKIASGGMGTVYRARQKSLNRIVAVKCPLPHVKADPERARKFRTEAESVAALNHPNIIPVIESGEWSEEQFFSMAYVEGKPLSDLGPLPPQTAARYARKIAEAMHHAHQRGVLHRDLKPANVIVDVTDEPRVADFGIACLLHENDVGESLAGTPNYMAPEQVQPGRKTLTVATDIYAIGGILYHMLTGQPPFEGDTKEKTLWAVFYEQPILPSRLRPHIPRDLEAICLKALEKDPAGRYASGQALAEDLARFEQGHPVTARPASIVRGTWMWVRRNPIVAMLLLALFTSVGVFMTAQMNSISAIRAARADSEGFIGFMNQDLAADLKDVGRLDLVERINQRAESYYTNHEALGDPGFMERKARFFENAASVQKDLGELDQADARAIDAETIYETQSQLEPRNAIWYRNRSRVRTLRQIIAKEAGLRLASEEHANAAVALAERAVASGPADPTNQASLAYALLERASFWIRQSRPDSASTNVLRAEPLLQEVVRQKGADPEWHLWLAQGAYYRALISQLRSDQNQALKEFRECLTGLQSLVDRFQRNRRWRYEIAITQSYIAAALMNLQQAEEARPYVEAFTAEAKALTSLDSRNKLWQALYAKSLAFEGESALRSRDRRATDYFEEALSIQRNLLRENPTRELWAVNARDTTRILIGIYNKEGRTNDARNLWADWTRECERLALDNPNHIGHQIRWGEAIVADVKLRRTNRMDQLEQLTRALAAFGISRSNGPIVLAKARILSNLADCHDLVGNKNSALTCMQESLELRLTVYEKSPLIPQLRDQIPNSFLYTAKYQLQLGQVDQTILIAERALQWAARHLVADENRNDYGELLAITAEAALTPDRVAKVKPLVQLCLAERMGESRIAFVPRLQTWLDQHP